MSYTILFHTIFRGEFNSDVTSRFAFIHRDINNLARALVG